MSCGDQKIQTCVHPFESSELHGCGVETEWSRELQYMLLYHFFGFLWTTQFFIAVSYLVVAYVFAKFYWSGADKMGMTPLLTSMKRMPLYHSGSSGVWFLLDCSHSDTVLRLHESRHYGHEKNRPKRQSFCRRRLRHRVLLVVLPKDHRVHQPKRVHYDCHRAVTPSAGRRFKR